MYWIGFTCPNTGVYVEVSYDTHAEWIARLQAIRDARVLTNVSSWIGRGTVNA